MKSKNAKTSGRPAKQPANTSTSQLAKHSNVVGLILNEHYRDIDVASENLSQKAALCDAIARYKRCIDLGPFATAYAATN